MRNTSRPSSSEWREFEDNALTHRRALERTLRREMVHDPRAAAARLQNVAARDLADESIAWALENWKAKPTGTTPEQWMRKRGLQMLDEALDREALDAESRAEERSMEGRLVALDVHHDDEERSRWLEVADMANPRRLKEGDDESADVQPFDGLACDPQVSSPEDRMDEREKLIELERALLKLPERRRKAVAHRFLDGLSQEEIAYLLDAPVAEVDREIAAGIQSLQQQLGARA